MIMHYCDISQNGSKTYHPDVQVTFILHALCLFQFQAGALFAQEFQESLLRLLGQLHLPECYVDFSSKAIAQPNAMFFYGDFLSEVICVNFNFVIPSRLHIIVAYSQSLQNSLFKTQKSKLQSLGQYQGPDVAHDFDLKPGLRFENNDRTQLNSNDAAYFIFQKLKQALKSCHGIRVNITGVEGPKVRRVYISTVNAYNICLIIYCVFSPIGHKFGLANFLCWLKQIFLRLLALSNLYFFLLLFYSTLLFLLLLIDQLVQQIVEHFRYWYPILLPWQKSFTAVWVKVYLFTWTCVVIGIENELATVAVYLFMVRLMCK